MLDDDAVLPPPLLPTQTLSSNFHGCHNAITFAYAMGLTAMHYTYQLSVNKVVRSISKVWRSAADAAHPAREYSIDAPEPIFGLATHRTQGMKATLSPASWLKSSPFIIGISTTAEKGLVAPRIEAGRD